jgi:hypothetical protein
LLASPLEASNRCAGDCANAEAGRKSANGVHPACLSTRPHILVAASSPFVQRPNL